MIISKTLNNYHLGEEEKTYFYQQTCPGESSRACGLFIEYACVIV